MENEEMKKIAEETLELSRENHAMLKKIRRGQKWAQVSRVIYWIMIIGVTFGAYYYLQPYLQKILSLYTDGLSQFDGFKEAGANIFK